MVPQKKSACKTRQEGRLKKFGGMFSRKRYQKSLQ